MVALSEPNPAWPLIFKEEADLIKGALGAKLLSIHHIGSTSIPGLIAKPKIDILAVVEAFSSIDFSKLEPLGYEYRGEVIPSGRYLSKPTPHIHLHVFEQGNPLIDRYLLFRDFLCTHKEDRDAYAQLKRELAKKHTHGMSYAQAKSDFIASIIETAQQD